LIEFKPVGSAEDGIGVHIPGDSNHVKHSDFPQFITLATLDAAGHERVGIRPCRIVVNGSDFEPRVFSRVLCGTCDDEEATGGKSQDVIRRSTSPARAGSSFTRTVLATNGGRGDQSCLVAQRLPIPAAPAVVQRAHLNEWRHVPALRRGGWILHPEYWTECVGLSARGLQDLLRLQGTLFIVAFQILVGRGMIRECSEYGGFQDNDGAP
jgi:hypothetical protein